MIRCYSNLRNFRREHVFFPKSDDIDGGSGLSFAGVVYHK